MMENVSVALEVPLSVVFYLHFSTFRANWVQRFETLKKGQNVHIRANMHYEDVILSK